MTIQGTVNAGTIRLPPEAPLPDETSVTLEVSAETSPRRAATAIGDILLKYAGTVDDLPPDASFNHDHYLYGTPKR